MNVTFLVHSGFLIELDSAVLLFDYWKGTLPPLPQKPLLVFVSHHHPDHFNPEIFKLPAVCFLLGKDIRLSPANRLRWQVTPEIAGRCTRLGGFRHEEPVDGITVETLPSTDEGVAFLVTAEGRTIYHAGDLNWWYWEGEPDPWNPQMEHNYKQYTAPLKGKHIDLAMVPLDSRMGAGEDKGLAYLLEIADIRHVLPMHQWDDFSPTARFIQRFPQWAERIIPVHHAGERFTISEKGELL